MAPEVFRHEQYDEQVDVYSFAMILFYMMSGQPPWASLPGFEAVRLASERGDRPALPKDLDGRSISLLKLCWHNDSSARPSFRKILSLLHTYMEDVFHSDVNSVAIALSPDLQQKWFCDILWIFHRYLYTYSIGACFYEILSLLLQNERCYSNSLRILNVATNRFLTSRCLGNTEPSNEPLNYLRTTLIVRKCIPI